MSKEQRAAIDALLRRPRPDESPTIEQLRAGFVALMATMRVPDDVRTERSELAGRYALRVERDHHPRPGTILYFHGGGWVMGSPETAISLTGALVSRTGLPALSLDYRLAPEHPFPAGIEDCLAAYRALLDGGTDPAGIAFAGDSAGGGMAITTCLTARTAGLPMPAAVVVFSPGLDATRTGASIETKAGIDPIFTREALAATSAMYLGDTDPRQPLISPAVYADLSGFPPLLVQVGTNELLLDDSTRLAARATDAGVSVVLDVTADVPHVFQSFTGGLDEADAALDRAALFLTQHL